jgi:hypothetical protein
MWLGFRHAATAFGWKLGNGYLMPVTTTSEPVPEDILNKNTCSCKSKCSNACGCRDHDDDDDTDDEDTDTMAMVSSDGMTNDDPDIKEETTLRRRMIYE